MSRRRLSLKWLNHLMWALPLLTGLAVYFAARETAPHRSGSSASRDRRVVESPRMPLAEAAEKLSTDDRARQDASDAAMLAAIHAMSVADLHRRLLDLRDHKTNGWQEWRDWSIEMEDLAKELVSREGAAGADWVFANSPSVYSCGMDAWANSDPDAALNYVEHSTRPCPCFVKTLSRLLNREAERGADALRNAVAAIHWDQFDDSYPGDRYGRESEGDSEFVRFGIVPPKDEALYKLWYESGAARTLAEGGMDLQDLFDHWFKDDPQAALENWATWPSAHRRGEEGAPRNVIDWLEDADSDDDLAATRGVLASATPETRAKVIAALNDKENASRVTPLREKYPELFLQAEEPGDP